jgi:NRAMP (natural resistance-associated macrophage protein)-like metal ion transporter
VTRRLLALAAVLGPGLVAANAGNDAGGIATYASVGARYGYDLLWMIVLITVSLIVVQEMAARMGVVTGKGLAELIREQYGPRWSLFSTFSVLVANLGICISEFVGIGAALELVHVPKYASVPIAAVVIWLLVVRGSYKVAQRVFVAMTLPFFAYPVAAVLAHPHWGAVGKAIVAPHIRPTGPYVVLFVATVGTTITPFMQLYRRSSSEASTRRICRPSAPRSRRRRSSRTSSRASSSSRPARRSTCTATTRSTMPPTRRGRLPRSPAASPRLSSQSGCSARACLPPRSFP